MNSRRLQMSIIPGIYGEEPVEEPIEFGFGGGLKKEEVKVKLEEGRVLQISRDRSREQEEKNDKWHRVKRSSGNGKADEVKAAMENGALTVTVPKEQVKKPEVKPRSGRRSQK